MMSHWQRQILKGWLALLAGWFLAVPAAFAQTYSLPAAIGSGPFSGCAFATGTTYNCAGNLSFGNNVVFSLTAPMTLVIGGNFQANNNLTIQNNGYTFTVQVGGNFDVNNNFTGDINVTAGGNIDIKNNGTINGNLTAGGNLVLGTGTVVTGNCTPSHPQCTGGPTCATDDFSSGTLDANLWNALAVSGSFTPSIVNVGGNNRVRLTSAGANQSTMLQLKRWLPGAGNKIIAEFQYFVYGGNGADGVAVVFSDASVAPAAGGFGGSLGYAQRSGVNGFTGGWLAVGIDEYGNFPNSTEGRQGYPAGWTPPAGANQSAGFYKNNISVRGSGSGTTGYRLLANTGVLTPPVWQSSNTSSSVQRFRITIDHSDSVNAWVTVDRDTTGTGSSYATLVPQFNALGANSGQAAVPENWLISFTGSTGGSNNNHELDLLSVCATYMNLPGGSTAASGFSCLETGSNSPWSTTARKPLYTKLANTNFTLDVAALKADGTLESNYVAAGGNSKYLRVELFDNTTPAASCADYASPVSAQTVTYASGAHSGTPGRVLSGNFNVGPYKKLICRVKECVDSSCASFSGVAPGCSTDEFAVRPHAFSLVSSASNTSSSGTPIFKAGADAFTLNVSARQYSQSAGSVPQTLTTLTGYSGTPKVGVLDLTPMGSGSWTAGTLSSGTTLAAAVSGVSNNSPTYSEVGLFALNGYWPQTAGYAGGNNSTQRAIYDDSWTAVDIAQGDCVAGSYSNRLAGGKYGCNFGLVQSTTLGRFTPDHFVISPDTVTPACSSAFTYFSQDGFSTAFTLTAQNASNGQTTNYQGAFAKLNPLLWNAYAFGTAAVLPAGAVLSTGATAPTGSWSAGQADVVARHQISRPTAPAAETAVTITAKPVDTDGITMPAAVDVSAAGTPLRFGRLLVDNAYGSELLDLPISIRAQYWNGTVWVRNVADNCTTIPASSIVMSGFTQNLSACETYFSPAGDIVLSGGQTTTPSSLIRLIRPGAGNNGSVNLAINIGAAASGDTCVSASSSPATAANLPQFGATNPAGLATFGIYKSPLIDRRENY